MSTKKSKPVRIVVLDKRFVLVGVYEQGDKEGCVTDGAIVRRWGTTNGLPEIAKGGPTPKTILDPVAGALKFPVHSIVFTIDCDEANWKKALSL